MGILAAVYVYTQHARCTWPKMVLCIHTNDTVPMLHLGLQRANRVTLPYSVYIFALLVCLFVR